jgi:hypothetical protein
MSLCPGKRSSRLGGKGSHLILPCSGTILHAARGVKVAGGDPITGAGQVAGYTGFEAVVLPRVA